MAEKITGRLQTPVDASGNRTDIHLITSTDEVITPDGKVLSDVLAHQSLQCAETKPDFPCLWFKPET